MYSVHESFIPESLSRRCERILIGCTHHICTEGASIFKDRPGFHDDAGELNPGRDEGGGRL